MDYLRLTTAGPFPRATFARRGRSSCSIRRLDVLAAAAARRWATTPRWRPCGASSTSRTVSRFPAALSRRRRLPAVRAPLRSRLSATPTAWRRGLATPDHAAATSAARLCGRGARQVDPVRRMSTSSARPHSSATRSCSAQSSSSSSYRAHWRCGDFTGRSTRRLNSTACSATRPRRAYRDGARSWAWSPRTV